MSTASSPPFVSFPLLPPFFFSCFRSHIDLAVSAAVTHRFAMVAVHIGVGTYAVADGWFYADDTCAFLFCFDVRFLVVERRAVNIVITVC